MSRKTYVQNGRTWRLVVSDDPTVEDDCYECVELPAWSIQVARDDVRTPYTVVQEEDGDEFRYWYSHPSLESAVAWIEAKWSGQPAPGIALDSEEAEEAESGAAAMGILFRNGYVGGRRGQTLEQLKEEVHLGLASTLDGAPSHVHDAVNAVVIHAYHLGKAAREREILPPPSLS